MEQLQSKRFTIPKEFLKTLGIELEKTTLICVIDDVMKQPDLQYIMMQYAKLVVNEVFQEKTTDTDI
jgi:bifunctional DNA-binding transcriptional regulator/antitoxin component of YhaV-PrlF toxin-antitoxin module